MSNHDSDVERCLNLHIGTKATLDQIDLTIAALVDSLNILNARVKQLENKSDSQQRNDGDYSHE